MSRLDARAVDGGGSRGRERSVCNEIRKLEEARRNEFGNEGKGKFLKNKTGEKPENSFKFNRKWKTATEDRNLLGKDNLTFGKPKISFSDRKKLFVPGQRFYLFLIQKLQTVQTSLWISRMKLSAGTKLSRGDFTYKCAGRKDDLWPRELLLLRIRPGSARENSHRSHLENGGLHGRSVRTRWETESVSWEARYGEWGRHAGRKLFLPDLIEYGPPRDVYRQCGRRTGPFVRFPLNYLRPQKASERSGTFRESEGAPGRIDGRFHFGIKDRSAPGRVEYP